MFIVSSASLTDLLRRERRRAGLAFAALRRTALRFFAMGAVP
jgi:hypothetical protein